MKRRIDSLVAVALLLLSALALQAQAPSSRKIPFNTVATTITCAPDPSPCQRSIILRMFDAATAGTQIGVDEPQTVSVDDPAGTGGSINFVLGSTRPAGVDPNDFQAGSSRFLDVLDAATSNTVLPARIELTAVAFAVNPGPQGPQGIQGPQGAQGPTGAQGPPGVVQTVSAGDASIAVGGTAADRLVSIAPNGVTNAHVANGALSPAKITGTAATLGPNIFAGDQNVTGNLIVSNPGGAAVESRGLFAVRGNAVAGGFAIVGNAPTNGIAGQFNGSVNVTGPLSAGANLTTASDILVGNVPNPAFPGSNSVFIENSGGDPKNSLRLDGYFDHLVIAADSAPGALGGAAIQFRTALAGGGEIERMEITPNGNVGIGTNAPTAKLDVTGDIKASGKFMGDGSGLSNLSASQFAGGGINPQQVALLKWYAANQTTSFNVGSNPQGMAFDGANIWVANGSSNNVSKLRASDGALLGTFPVGTGAVRVAFDGVNIWVASQADNNVWKLRASDGALLGTFAVGNAPEAVAFDGANIWVANERSNNVTELRASDGALLGTFTVGAVPVGVAFDGANIWVTNSGSNTVSKL